MLFRSDDANVGRFLAMLDGFLAESQFVVVTHNKGTMAAADMLYGITMQTKGVSTRVAVELSDVDGFVPEATGDALEAARMREEVGSADPLDADDEPPLELVPQPRPERARGAPAAERVEDERPAAVEALCQ